MKFELEGFRDITIAWQGVDGKWGVNIGAKNGDDGKALLYHSEDFVNWKLHPNHASDNTGMFESLDFFQST